MQRLKPLLGTGPPGGVALGVAGGLGCLPTSWTWQHPPSLGTPEPEAPQAALPPRLAPSPPLLHGLWEGELSPCSQPSPHDHCTGEAGQPAGAGRPVEWSSGSPAARRQAPEARAGAGVDKQDQLARPGMSPSGPPPTENNEGPSRVTSPWPPRPPASCLAGLSLPWSPSLSSAQLGVSTSPQPTPHGHTDVQ